MNKQPENPNIFHMASIGNLESIVRCEKLKSKNGMSKTGTSFINIAYNDIQELRAKVLIPGTNDNLHDYVPFMFAPRSPMLYTLAQGNVTESEEKNQKNFIYLVSNVNKVKDLDFVFTDYHAILRYTTFYKDLNDLCYIDWDVIFDDPPIHGGYCRYFQSRVDNQKYIKRRDTRQAEFLIKDEFPLSYLAEIAVFDQMAKDIVESILRRYNIIIDVSVIREWYF